MSPSARYQRYSDDCYLWVCRSRYLVVPRYIITPIELSIWRSRSRCFWFRSRKWSVHLECTVCVHICMTIYNKMSVMDALRHTCARNSTRGWIFQVIGRYGWFSSKSYLSFKWYDLDQLQSLTITKRNNNID